jgi:galactokinase
MRSVAWRAPGRVNLIGEHTDYNDGFALPLAIAQGCTARVRPLDDGVLHVESAQENDSLTIALDEVEPGNVDGWAAYVAGVVWPLRTRGSLTTGVSVALDSDVPVGAGLSSSAAVVCSVATALDDALDLRQSVDELIALTRSAENDFVGAPTGGMDQLASICSRAGAALLCDMRTLTTRRVPMALDAAGLVLLVVDTRAPHGHAGGEYGDRRAACRRAAQLLGVDSLRDVQDDDHATVLDRLADAAAAAGAEADVLVRRVRHVLTENDRTLGVARLLEDDRIAEIGPLLSASHVSMRDDYEITVPEVDVAVTAAVEAGAVGARMTGGGFGGCIIALCPTESVSAVRDAVAGAFAAHRFTPPEMFETAPADGAHRHPDV